MKPAVKTVGAFEKVSFPEFSIKDIVAKIDTGAYTGSLHCTLIKLKDTKKGKVLQFSPFDLPDLVKTTDQFFIRPVKSSNGVEEKRFFIDTEIIIDGKQYPIILSLANRSEMKVAVLIGRRFLQTYNLVVDARRLNK